MSRVPKASRAALTVSRHPSTVDTSAATVSTRPRSPSVRLASARLSSVRVTIGARTEESLADARRTLGERGRVETVAADVSTVEGCRETVKAALDAFGTLDILFTNAGNYEAQRIEDTTEESWDRTINVHLKGTFFCILFALGALRASRGAIVTMASDAGLSGTRGGWGVYCAAMGGVVNLTRQ